MSVGHALFGAIGSVLKGKRVVTSRLDVDMSDGRIKVAFAGGK